jgi:hypothetical protein
MENAKIPQRDNASLSHGAGNVKIKNSKDDPPNKFEGLNIMTTPRNKLRGLNRIEID